MAAVAALLRVSALALLLAFLLTPQSFAPLFAPPVVVVLLGSLAAADVWLARSGRILPAFADTLTHPLLLLVVLGFSFVSILFLECGHAAPEPPWHPVQCRQHRCVRSEERPD